MKCVRCDTALDTGSRFCEECGAQQPDEPVTTTTLSPPGPVGLPLPGGNGSPAAGAFTPSAARLPIGTVEQNAHYLGSRMQYENSVDIKFGDPDLVARQARSEMRGNAILAIAIVVLWGGLGSILLRAIGLGPLGVLWFAATIIAACIILIGPFWRRRNTPLNEWKLLVDGKAAVADDVYDHIAAELVARSSPVQYRAVALEGVWWRGYLQVRMGQYNAYITCFPFGSDLYMGWSLWWSASWLELIREQRKMRANLFVTLLTLPYVLVQVTLQGRDSTAEMGFVHQFDEVKALRECVHSVTLKGAEAAMGSIATQGRGTIGSTVPEGISPAFAGRGRPV